MDYVDTECKPKGTALNLNLRYTKQVSEKLEIAWQTAKNNLICLCESGYVNMEEREIWN